MSVKKKTTKKLVISSKSLHMGKYDPVIPAKAGIQKTSKFGDFKQDQYKLPLFKNFWDHYFCPHENPENPTAQFQLLKELNSKKYDNKERKK